MHKAVTLSFLSLALVSSSFTSCTPSNEEIQLATGKVAAGDAKVTTKLYQEAQQLEAKGRLSKAAKTYGELATSYPFSPLAPDARLREADILYSQGELVKSFDKYQLFITQYQNTTQYSKAIERQSDVAHSASTGKIKNSFLGLKTDIARSQVEEMFNQVRDNAPFGPTAPKAQFGLAEMWQRDNNKQKAIKAYEDFYVKYPKSSLAPEALLRVGNLLLEQSAAGNRNKANLDSARTSFTDITQLYPNSSQAKIAKAKLKQIKGSDVQRSFDNAEFYAHKKEYAAAAFYYNEVLRAAQSGSPLHTLAKQRLAALPK